MPVTIIAATSNIIQVSVLLYIFHLVYVYVPFGN